MQQILGLTPGNLITHLRKLEEAGYVTSIRPASDGQARTALALTHTGRAALERYTAAIRRLLDQAHPPA
jgi:DNA-binding MarR family transcriptional regulator